MSKGKLVIFGPWLGEFCYELSWYIPRIRKLMNTVYTGYTSVAVGFDGRKILYDDFTDAYIPYPVELDEMSKYPSCGGEFRGGSIEVIPHEFKQFVEYIKKEYSDDFDEIVIEYPQPELYSSNTSNLTNEELPFGEFKHYTASDNILQQVESEIKFDNSRDTIALMARIRTRNGKTCKLDWNPKHWKTFINLLVQQLQVNIVMIGIKQKDGSSAGASITFENTDYIKSIDFSGTNSVERQIALLKLTKCSIYGASGTAVFPFFTKTPTFTQQTKQEGFRLMYQWERDLTDNLKNVAIFDKYNNNEIYDAPPHELYDEFNKFYKTVV